jgi:sortase B
MKKKKNKIITFFICIIFILSMGCFIISIKDVLVWKNHNNKIENQTEDITNLVDIEDVRSTASEEIITPSDEITKFDPYWDYIKMSLINVDFTELKEKNSHTKGWIQVGGTNVNYPFVQTKDNKYYLTRSFDKKYNSAGWVFLDYRNNIDSDKNIILYAHSMLDKTMFGSLRNILTNNWLNNTDNYIIKLSTETHNTLWQVFSVYRIPTTSDYLKIDFYSNEDFLDFSNKLINRSQYNFNTTINESDKILTLSTCYNEEEKVVLHAKLIKIETKNS